MADNKFGDGIKTILLAGVGAVAFTAEKGQEIIGELVKKGEITMEQGKDLNKDFQRSFKESMDKRGINLDELGQKFSKMSEEEIAKVKEQIAAAEKVIREKMTKAEEISQEMASTGEFFGLKIHGDSMEPRMYEGNVVIVRKQEDADSGDIVIAMVNGDDATCKRLVKYENGINLLSLNSKYAPIVFSKEEIETKPVRIIGKVVELRGKF